MPSFAGMTYYTHQSGGLETLPVLLVHGAGGSHLDWPASIRHLERVRIFAPDLPGHGKSPGTGHQTVDEYSRLLIDWLEALKISKAAIVGHSMGGAIALRMALSYPEKVAALGLISTGAKLAVLPQILRDSADPSKTQRAVRSLVERYFTPKAPPELIQHVEARLNRTRPSVLHADLTACNQFNVIEQVSSIRCPTLVLCGAEDSLTPVRYSEFLAREIPGAQLDIIPAAAHMVMLESSRLTAEALSHFFEGFAYQAGD